MSLQFFPDHPTGLEEARIVLVPVPYDRTCTWAKGAAQGPDALLAASEHLEGYDLDTGTEVWRQGIATDLPIQIDAPPDVMVEAVQRRTAEHLKQDRFTVIIGGEHSVSIGAVRAHADRTSDLTVLQLDAHADTRDSYQGSRFNHACVMARVKECCPIVQAGVRSMAACELASVDPNRIFYAEDIIHDRACIDDLLEQLSPQVYVTIDLDVFDPAFMPATGTPEPGGLSWYEVLALLKAVCDRSQVVGFDIVELCPLPNHRAPDFLAAKLIYTLLSYRFKKNWLMTDKDASSRPSPPLRGQVRRSPSNSLDSGEPKR